MDRLSLLLENSKRAIRYWWLLLLVGVILIVAGISVFLYPVQSYLGLTVLFGWLMLVSGVLEAVLASSIFRYGGCNRKRAECRADESDSRSSVS